MRGSAAGGEGFEEAALKAMEECDVTPDILLYQTWSRTPRQLDDNQGQTT